MPGIGRPFPPGISGNAGGRPKANIKVVRLARKVTLKAMRALEAALDAERTIPVKDGDALSVPDHATRVYAAEALLNRGWGRPCTADVMAKLVADVQEQGLPETTGLTTDQLERMWKIAREGLP